MAYALRTHCHAIDSSVFDRAVCDETCVISPEIGVNMGGDGTLGSDYVWR